MEGNSRRRNYFIDPVFQTSFIMRFCAVVIVSACLIGGIMFFVLQGSTTVTIADTKVVAKPTVEVILPHLLATLLVVAVFASLAVIAMTLFVSHKIAGPIFRISREVDYVEKGDLTRDFHIRDRDQLQELAHRLAGMTRTLRQKHLEIGGQCRALTNFLEEKDFTASPEDRQRLHKMLKDLYDILNYFKV
ncbi:MAG: hypothetical protein ACLFPX_00745 [Candidatus Omnitrophota bacterium]